MENYIVSARKYRPMTFDTVVGQHALTTTLKNAVKSGKLAHAYLFCGPRGVGKTTCARIFAKAINCMNPRQRARHATSVRAARRSTSSARSTSLSSTPPATTRWRTSRLSWSRRAYRRRWDATRCSSSTRFTCCRRQPSTPS